MRQFHTRTRGEIRRQVVVHVTEFRVDLMRNVGLNFGVDVSNLPPLPRFLSSSPLFPSFFFHRLLGVSLELTMSLPVRPCLSAAISNLGMTACVFANEHVPFRNIHHGGIVAVAASASARMYGELWSARGLASHGKHIQGHSPRRCGLSDTRHLLRQIFQSGYMF